MSTNLSEVAAIRRSAVAGDMRARREAARVSIPELARPIGVTTATLSRWERGTLRPTFRNAERWLRALERVEGER